MAEIRVVVAEISGLLRDILAQTLADEDDIEVVGEAASRDEALQLVRCCGANVVVVGCSQDMVPEVGEEFTQIRSDVRLLAIADDGRKTLLFQLLPATVDLGELSPAEVIRAIRNSVEDTVKTP